MQRRPVRKFAFVHISYIVRLRPDALRQRGFTGEIEAVTSGNRHAFGSIDQVVSFVLETMDDEMSGIRDAQLSLRSET